MTGEIINKHKLEETQRRIREDNTSMQARIDELKAENERLREALRITDVLLNRWAP